MDWKDTAWQLMETELLDNPLVSAMAPGDRTANGIRWIEYHDTLCTDLLHTAIPDLTDDATAGVLLGMLADRDYLGNRSRAAGWITYRVDDDGWPSYSEDMPWGHAIALALLEVSS